MKSKKVSKKQVEEVVEENEEESEIEESEGELPGSDEDSDTSSDEDVEMEEIPDLVKSNQTILDKLNEVHNSDNSDDVSTYLNIYWEPTYTLFCIPFILGRRSSRNK